MGSYLVLVFSPVRHLLQLHTLMRAQPTPPAPWDMTLFHLMWPNPTQLQLHPVWGLIY